jgi:hypothetical protein
LSSNSAEIQGLAWRDPASGVFHAVKLDVRTAV